MGSSITPSRKIQELDLVPRRIVRRGFRLPFWLVTANLCFAAELPVSTKSWSSLMKDRCSAQFSFLLCYYCLNESAVPGEFPLFAQVWKGVKELQDEAERTKLGVSNLGGFKTCGLQSTGVKAAKVGYPCSKSMKCQVDKSNSNPAETRWVPPVQGYRRSTGGATVY